MKKTILFLTVLLSLGLAACSDDEKHEQLDKSTPVYQYYQVDFYENKVNAFANFHKNGITGNYVELNNGASIAVNGEPMLYFNHKEASEILGVEYLFDYSIDLGAVSGDIKFQFRRDSENTYTNSVNRNDITAVNIPESLKVDGIYKVYNNEPIVIDYDARMGEVFSAYLMPKLSAADLKTYQGKFSYENKTVTFSGVPNGTYTLQFINQTERPTLQNDRTANGRMVITYVDVETVVVENR